MEWFKVFKGAPRYIGDSRYIGEIVLFFHADTVSEVKQRVDESIGVSEWLDQRVFKGKDGEDYHILPVYDKTMKKNEKEEYDYRKKYEDEVAARQAQSGQNGGGE